MDYEKNFDSKDYLNRFFKTTKGSKEENYENYFYDQLDIIFKMDIHNGEWLLDIGTGPSMYTTFFSSRKYKNIILSDYSTNNRDELVKWLNNENDAHNWRDFSNYAAIKEDTSDNYEAIEKRARISVKAVLHVDVNKSSPLEPNWFKKFDCILTALCLEAACVDFNSYQKAICNLKSLLKQNGYLVLTGVLDETFYLVGEHKWKTVCLKLEHVRNAICLNNFKIIYEHHVNLNRKEFIESDCQGLFALVAQAL